MTSISREELGRATLARQLLLARERVEVVAAVERLGGLQAQEPRPPFVALWSRLEGFAADDLRRALASGKVLRATMMRATLHLMSARDVRVLRSALQPALSDAMRGALKGRDGGFTVDELLPAAEELLPATFNELRPQLLERFPEANERALGYAVRTNLPVAMVPSEDRWGFPRDATFRAVKVTRKPRPDELARRYLGAFGPATAADLQTWSGLKGTAEVLEGMELWSATDPRGRTVYDLPDAPRPTGGEDPPARLLPDFDSLMLAHADRSRIIDDAHRGKVATKNLRIRATFLVGGRVAGTWAPKGKRVELAPFGRVAKAARAELEAEGEALTAFLAAA
jgi:hypothetical protein